MLNMSRLIADADRRAERYGYARAELTNAINAIDDAIAALEDATDASKLAGFSSAHEGVIKTMTRISDSLGRLLNDLEEGRVSTDDVLEKLYL